jgi:hypothetical protein
VIDRRVAVGALIVRKRRPYLTLTLGTLAFRYDTFLTKRHTDDALAAFREKAHLQPLVGVENVVFPFRIAIDIAAVARRRREAPEAPEGAATDGEPLHQHTIQPDIEVVRLSEPADVFDVVGLKVDFGGVLAVHGEVMPDGQAAARPEREIFAQPLGLIEQRVDAVSADGRSGRRRADRHAADFSGCRHVAVEQRRRNRQNVRHVVEAVRMGIV